MAEIYRPISCVHVKIGQGFWKKKQDTNRLATLPSVWEQFYNTGRVTA